MNNRLSIPEIAGLLSEYTGKSKKSCEQFLKEFVIVVRENVFEDRIVKIKGIGTFKIIFVDDRESVDVNTGNRILIPGHYKFSFVPDKDLREQVNKPFSIFETVEISDHIDTSEFEFNVDKTPVQETPTPLIEKSEEVETLSDIEDISQHQEEELELPQIELINDDSSTEQNIPKAEAEVEKVDIQEDPEEAESLEKTNTQDEKDEEIPVVSDENPEEEKRPGYFIPKSSQPVAKSPEPEEKKSSLLRNLTIMLGVVLLLGGGSLFFLNRHSIFAKPDADLTEIAEIIANDLIHEMYSEDTEKEGVEEIIEDIADEVHEQTTETTADPKTKEKVIATVKIEAGSRLTLIALEHYGEKVFWVYLYEYNKQSIKDPNNIPIGTEISIPAPELYGINAKSKASLDKAAILQSQILTGL